MELFNDILAGEGQAFLLAGLILSLLLGALLGWASGYGFRAKEVGQLQTKLVSETDQAALVRERNDLLSAELDLNRAEIERLSGENAAAAERVLYLEEKIESQGRIENLLSQTLETRLSDVANLVLEAQEKRDMNKDTSPFQQILAPVTEQFSELQKRVEEFLAQGDEGRSHMQEVMNSISDYTSRLDASADQLLKALKSEHHVYGNWGKTVLARIMELAGLKEGREYRVFPKDEGIRFPELVMPDVVVSLPGDRDLLIDSKVSLEHWNHYVDVADEDKRKNALKLFADEIKTKVNAMGEQDYSQFPSIREVDFLFLFIPVEAAWVHLMQEDPGIAAYAQENRIAVVSASNLLLALKLVSSLWRSEQRFANVDKILERAHLLYKKWQSFAQDLARVGTALNRMQNEYGKAMNKLTSGRGNLVRQTEELIEMGVARPAGKLPDAVVPGLHADALDEEEAEDSAEEQGEDEADTEETGGKKSSTTGKKRRAAS